MPDNVTFDAQYDAASGGDAVEMESIDDSEETEENDSTVDDEPSESGDEQDETEEEAEGDEEDEDTDASDSDETPQDGDDITFDSKIKDALKDKPELLKRLDQHEKGARDLHHQVKGSEYMIFDSPVDKFAGAFELMAKARNLEPEQFATDILKALGKEPVSTQAKEDDWDPFEMSYEELREKGYESAREVLLERQNRELDARLAKVEQISVKAEAEKREAAERQRQDDRIEKQSKSVASRLKAEAGWDVAPKKVAAALKQFPTLDPIQAVKAAYPDDYANHRAGISKRIKKGPNMPKNGNRNPENRVRRDASFGDMYDHVSRTVAD